jgi:hypothetical protein
MRFRRLRIRPRTAYAAACLALGLGLGAAGTTAAAEPNASQIVEQMRAAFDPDRPSIRQLELSILGESSPEGTKFQLIQARKRLPDGRRSLTVLIGPAGARGMAHLVQERKGEVPDEYTYLPMVQRVRKLVGAENQAPFLNSDFTFADLGFIPPTEDTLVGAEKIAGHDVFKVESIPSPRTQQWYYSKVATWIDKQNLLPVQRDFYSPAGQVFRIQTFGEAARMDGIPTILETTMESVGASTRSKLTTTNIVYKHELPDDLFTPASLPTAVDTLEKLGATRSK